MHSQHFAFSVIGLFGPLLARKRDYFICFSASDYNGPDKKTVHEIVVCFLLLRIGIVDGRSMLL